MLNFSKRINNLTCSPINQYSEYVEEIEKKGTRFYKLNIIQPDIKTDISYYKALKRLKVSANGYTDSKGIFELRNSFANYCNEKGNKNLYNFNNIIVTNGASDAIMKTLLTICDEEDEIILLEPFFSDYLQYTKLFNIKVKSLPYYNINKNDLEKLITKKTKCILFSNPNNPDGNILSKKDINIILSVSKKYNIFVISDEVYSEIYYKEINSLLKYGDNDRLIVIDSVSKKFCNCGARIGFIISKNINFINKIHFINDCKISISNSEQIAITQMLKKRYKIFNTIKNTYKKRLNKIIYELDKIDNIKYSIPKGGLSIIADIACNSKDFCEWLIYDFRFNNKTLLLTPAEQFFLTDKGITKIRMAITLPENELIEAIKILNIALHKYKGGDNND